MLAHLQRLYTSRSRTTRELLIFGGAALIGLILIPLATWLVGNRLLGPYTHGPDAHPGGPLALLGDFFAGLRSGAVTFWIVACGPLVFVLLIRLTLAVLRLGNSGADPE